MPDNKKTKPLIDLIAQIISDDPHEWDGFVWAARPQNFYCEELGISLATLRRRISKPPFVRARIQIDGKIVTLLRIGKPGPMTKKHCQNVLAKIWKKKTGREISRTGYGHLGGLVDEWGIDKAPEVLKLVLNNWELFMVGVHQEITLLGNDGFKRYYEYPSSSVILRFNNVGKEIYMMKLQEKMADNPKYALLG